MDEVKGITMANERDYELIVHGPKNKDTDPDQVKEILIRQLHLHEAEAEKFLHDEYRLYPLYKDQALHIARELNQLGIASEIMRHAKD